MMARAVSYVHCILFLGAWGIDDTNFQTNVSEFSTTQSLNTQDFTSFTSNQRNSQTKVGGPLIRGTAKTLGLYLHGLAIKELGIRDIELVLDESTFVDETVDDALTVRKLAEGISQKISRYRTALAKSKSAVEVLYFISHPNSPPIGSFAQCCDISPLRLKYSTSFGVAVNKDFYCDTLPIDSRSSDQSLSSNLSSVFSLNMGSNPGIRWQFLINMEGHEYVYPGWGSPGRPCNPLGVQHNKVFIETMYKFAKTVVILLDTRLLPSQSHMDLRKSTAKFVISLLSESDRVAVVALDSVPTVLDPYPTESCLMGRLVPASRRFQSRLRELIDRRRSSESRSSLASGINSALNILRQSDATENVQLFFVTSGRRTKEQNPENISAVFQEAEDSGVKFTFSVLEIVDENSEVSPFWKMNIPPQNLGNIVPVASNQSLPLKKSFLFHSSRKTSNEVLVHRARLDPAGGGMVVPMSQLVAIKDFMIGVIGLDIQAAELFEDVVHHGFRKDSRIFLIDMDGFAVVHPALKSPEEWRSAELPMISQLEVYEDFDAALHRMKSFPSGNYILESESNNISYSWHHVEGTNHIVVVASMDSTVRTEKQLETLPLQNENPDIQFHDLIPDGKSKLCRHMREIASMQTAALYLSPAAYALPFEYHNEVEIPLRIQSFMAYLTDPTRLIANPGLKSGVRNDVNLVSSVVRPWKDLAFSSPLNNYIIRRKIYTPSGVQLSYPGSTVQMGTESSKEFWFQKSVKFPNRVVVSPPRLDPGGAGFIITVSKALLASNSSDNQYLAAVVSADYTLGYLYKILNDSVPDGFCSQENSRCFLIDDRGNMVAHPLLDGDVMKFSGFPSEAQHLTHMETFIATDILVNQDFMLKKVCRSLTDGKLHRYFQLDLDNSSVVRNSRSADNCINYKVTAVPGTNLFLGLVQQTCNSSAFCWCSTMDRTCLDCQSWEQGECECPCECNDKETFCQVTDKEDKISPCEPAPASYEPQRYTTSRHGHYPPCIHTDCASRSTQQECFGVLGCSWCHTDQDGVSELKSPVCVDQVECFGGVLNSPSPYSRVYDHSLVLSNQDEERSLSRAGPIGPVTGGILVFFLLLALTVWGYKHWSSGERRLLSGRNGSSQRINQIEAEEEPEETIPPGGHQNYGLHNGDPSQQISVVSPYRMNPSYRRPRPAGTDSDHGYSTMTPCGDQDSEIMSCLGDGPVPNRRPRNRNPMSLQSVTSGNSSRTSSPLQGPVEMSVLSGDEKPSELPANSTERENLMERGINPGFRREETCFADPDPGKMTSADNAGQNHTPTGNTVLGKHQFIVAATVHMVDT